MSRFNFSSGSDAMCSTVYINHEVDFKMLFNLGLQVTAKGSPDVALSWIFDLQLGMARLFGQLCSAALASRKGWYTRPVKQSPVFRGKLWEATSVVRTKSFIWIQYPRRQSWIEYPR